MLSGSLPLLRGQVLIELGCATPHLELARQDRLLSGAPAPHAFLHSVPNPEQARTDVVLGAPAPLIGHHHVTQGHAVFAGHREHLVSRTEMVREVGRVFDQYVAARRVFIDNEAPADRVIHSTQQLTIIIPSPPRAEPHAVGVIGHRSAIVEYQVLGLDKFHRPATEELELPGGADPRDSGVRGIGVDTLRGVPFEAQQHRLVAAVPAAG